MRSQCVPGSQKKESLGTRLEFHMLVPPPLVLHDLPHRQGFGGMATTPTKELT